MLFITATQHKKQSDKELLGSVTKIENEDELRLSEVMKNSKKARKVIKIINRYEEILKGQNEKIINIVGKQGELLNLFKELDNFLRMSA